MKRTELEALGLDREQIRAVQKIHGIDIERERNKPDSQVRHVINALYAVIRLLPPEALHALLVHATTLYNQHTLTPDMTAAAAMNPPDVEPNGLNLVEEATDIED